MTIEKIKEIDITKDKFITEVTVKNKQIKSTPHPVTKFAANMWRLV